MFAKIVSVYLLNLAILAHIVHGQATINRWTNASGNCQWVDPCNWSLGVVPGPDSGFIQINPQFILGEPKKGPTIGPGHVALTGKGDIWGPESGPIKLTIAGGSYTSSAYIGLQATGNNEDERPIIELGPEGTGGWLDVQNLYIGCKRWESGGQYATFNQYSGTTIIRDTLCFGGRVNLHGGVTYVFKGLGAANPPSELCRFNVTEGILVVPELLYHQIVHGLMEAGHLVAYDGAGRIVIEEMPQYYPALRITAVPPPSE